MRYFLLYRKYPKMRFSDRLLGARQVQGAEVAQYGHDVAGKCKSLIYTKGA
jgi:hypothetical protein